MERKTSFTGHSRRRVTRFSVRLGEFLSRWLIRIGGIGTIVAVILVGVFLIYVAAPLFYSAKVTVGPSVPVASPASPLLRFGADEYQLLGWEIFADGSVQVIRLDTGKIMKKWQLFEKDEHLTACSSAGKTSDLVFGFADGSLRFGRVNFTTSFLKDDQLTDELRNLPKGEIAEYKDGLVLRTEEDQLRVQRIDVEPGEPVKVDNESLIVGVDLSLVSDSDSSPGTLCFVSADGRLHAYGGDKKISNLTDTLIFKPDGDGGELQLVPSVNQEKPARALLSGVGDNVFVAWKDGHCVRISLQDVTKPKIVEEFNLVNSPGVTLTAVEFMVGKTTLLVGDSSGRLRAWFRVQQPNATTGDGNVMVMAHDLGQMGAAISSLAVSNRTRMAAAGTTDGHVRLFNVTSEKNLAALSVPDGAAVNAVLIAPKDDALLIRTAQSILTCHIDAANNHQEITLASLFAPAWYEGYNKPTNTLQTSGPEGYEPKYGFLPLIFGTLKATFYSLLIGVPLALLAAVYTSEFLNPSAKAIVKPTVEMMASLPSVVLGFLAAMVVVPFVERWLATVLAGLFAMPMAFALAAYVWQLLPEKVGLLLSRYRFLFILCVLPVGVLASALAGPPLERVLFHGNLKGWLNGGPGTSATSGWFLLLLPFALGTTFLLLAQVVNPWLRHRTTRVSRSQHALLAFVKFIVAACYTAALAYLAAELLTLCGLDPRGTFLGGYDQRNALVVGFMMGFAIIPIIFTIAEDALSAVPEHLRSASLGCGATPWQTATRIIIPTAMSGLFSAVMVGLGRAVGETMIVLMATGNTPIIDMNMFNGFRTLSAEIATELPEAVVGSWHYRTLFLAAVVLFAMTFVLNTVAEVIRQRFRRRAYQL